MDTKFVVSNSPELVSQCASTALGDTHAAFDGPRFQDRPAISFPGARTTRGNQTRYGALNLRMCVSCVVLCAVCSPEASWVRGLRRR